MRYYTRAMKFIKQLFGKFRETDWRDRIPWDRVRELRQGMGRWKEGLSDFGKNFDRQKIIRHKSFQSIKNFDYEKFFDQIFSPRFHRSIHWSFLVAFLVVVTYSMGKMAAYVVLPPEKPVPLKKTAEFNQQLFDKDSREELQQIISTDLFRAEDKKDSVAPAKEKGEKRAKANLACNDSNTKSSLPFKLSNTIVLQNSKKSLAAVEQGSKKKILYLREGDSVENISVKKIFPSKMVFVNHRTGECEYVANYGTKRSKLWESRKPRIVSPERGRKLIEGQKDERVVKVGNTYQIKKEVKNEILDNIDTILTQARAVEIKNPDGSLCFKMVDIVPGSPYSMLDIQDNDVICSINGKKIEDLNSLFALFGKMRSIRNVGITVKRDGREIPMEYNFE